jgi:hypothetical protein
MGAESAPPHSRLCLNALAPHTLDVMRELETTTSEDIANMIIDKLTRTTPSRSSQKTIRHRIYDVINVLSAAGVVDKVGKQIVWHGGRQAPNARPNAAPRATGDDDARIAAKERMLRDKVSLLTLYKALIKRNFAHEPTADVLGLPVILLGIKDAAQITFTQSLNRCELEVRSTGGLVFMAPSEILQKINLERKTVKGILDLSPELARYGTQLLQD